LTNILTFFKKFRVTRLNSLFVELPHAEEFAKIAALEVYGFFPIALKVRGLGVPENSKYSRSFGESRRN